MGLWSIVAPILTGVGGALVGEVFGGDEERSAAQRPYTAAEMMPEAVRAKWQTALARTPASMNVNFGGKQYPVINKNALQAAMSLYSPAMSAPTPTPNAFVSGLTAAMPAIIQGMSNWQNTNVTPAVTPNVTPMVTNYTINPPSTDWRNAFQWNY